MICISEKDADKIAAYFRNRISQLGITKEVIEKEYNTALDKAKEAMLFAENFLSKDKLDKVGVKYDETTLSIKMHYLDSLEKISEQEKDLEYYLEILLLGSKEF